MASSGAGNDPNRNYQSQPSGGWPLQWQGNTRMSASQQPQQPFITGVSENPPQQSASAIPPPWPPVHTPSVITQHELIGSIWSAPQSSHHHHLPASLSTQSTVSPVPGSSRPAHSLSAAALEPPPLGTVPSLAPLSDAHASHTLPTSNWVYNDYTAGMEYIQTQSDAQMARMDRAYKDAMGMMGKHQSFEEIPSSPVPEIYQDPIVQSALDEEMAREQQTLEEVPLHQSPMLTLELRLEAEADTARPHKHCAKYIYDLQQKLNQSRARKNDLKNTLAVEKAKLEEASGQWLGKKD